MSEYHLHVDAVEIDSSLVELIQEKYNFYNTAFSHVPEEVEHFEAPFHYTLKSQDSTLIRRSMSALIEEFTSHRGFSGYIEAEYVPSDIELEDRPKFTPNMDFPFRLSKRFLEPGTFRQSEIHVTMLVAEFHSPVADALRQIGFFTASMLKPHGLVQIFTAQGSFAQVNELLPLTMAYLKNVGGYTHASIKEERIIDWWVSDATTPLPPVIDKIHY